MKISRRKFIASVGGAAAGAAAFGGFAQTPQDTKNILKAWALQQEQWSPSICQQCPGGCGMLVRVVDGEVVQLAGNPLHPINRGGLCMKGVSSTQVLYDPDRIKSPLAREGNRGEGKWKAISWDEALQKLTANLSQLRSEGKAHTVGLLGGQYRGLRDEIFQRFCEAYGTPNYMRLRSMKPEQEQSTFRFMQGHDRPLTYDLQNSRFVLSFGVNLLEGWSSPVSQQLAHGKQRAGDMGQRGKLAQVDPRYSVTAAKADYWLPVKPGTDAALALGLANVIIQESLEDREFIRDKTYGYDDFKTPDGKVHMGFKRMVLENYHPEEVSRITGIPVEKIFQVARAFARSRPAVAIGERGPSFHANDFYTRMAIHSLNALVGAIGIKGGVVVQGKVPLAPWAQLELDDAAQAGLAKGRIDQSSDNDYLATDSPAKKLLENIEKGSPYQLSTLLVYHTNPLFSQTNSDKWKAALDKVPFIVSFSPFLDETTMQADLVLPDSTFLERWQADMTAHIAGFTSFTLGRPAIKPIHDTRQTEVVLMTLAKGLGESMEAAFPWETMDELLYEKAMGLFESGRGNIIMDEQREAFQSLLSRQGLRREIFESYDDFWEELNRKGAWWDSQDTFTGPRQLFKTPSGKFEFYSQTLRKDMAKKAGGNSDAQIQQYAQKLGIQAKGDQLFLPHYENQEPQGDTKAYPFVLNSYKLGSMPGGRGANQPWLQQNASVQVNSGWESWVEISPTDAAQHRITDGDMVHLESPKGRIVVKAKILKGAQPGILNIPFGQGHTAYGRWAKDRGANPNTVIAFSDDPSRGYQAWNQARVRLMKA